MVFDRVYNHYDKFMKLFGLYKIEQIEEVLELQGNEIILDIGGGTGYLANHLSESCRKIYVLDESARMLSKLRTSDKVIPIVGDALNLTVIKDNIDIIILSDVFHHIKEQEELLTEIKKKLSINGKLLILEFNKEHHKVKILRFFEHILFGKLYFLSTDDVKEVVLNKFSIKKFVDYKYYFIILGEQI